MRFCGCEFPGDSGIGQHRVCSVNDVSRVHFVVRSISIASRVASVYATSVSVGNSDTSLRSMLVRAENLGLHVRYVERAAYVVYGETSVRWKRVNRNLGETTMRRITHYIALTSKDEVGTFRTLAEALGWLNAREPHLSQAAYTTHILSGNCTVRKVVPVQKVCSVLNLSCHNN